VVAMRNVPELVLPDPAGGDVAVESVHDALGQILESWCAVEPSTDALSPVVALVPKEEGDDQTVLDVCAASEVTLGSTQIIDLSQEVMKYALEAAKYKENVKKRTPNEGTKTQHMVTSGAVT